MKNNFEVVFSGLPDVTFFIREISVPSIKQNMAELYYNGRKIEIPINYDYNHEFTITVLNDG